jgi:hypothetical protein
MFTLRGAGAGVVFIALAGCETESDPGSELAREAAPPWIAPDLSDTDAGEVFVDEPLEASDSEYQRRWILRVPTAGAPCPAPVAGFALGTPTGKLFDPAPPGSLGRYCLYVAAVAAPPACPIMNCGPNNPAPDRMFLGMQASLEPLVRGEFSDLFLQQMSGPPVVLPPPPGSPGNVRLTLFDSLPDALPNTVMTIASRSEHGHTLANLVGHQPGGSTPLAAVHANLALQLYTDTTGEVVEDTASGGDFGSVSYLAAAVYEELRLWKAEPSPRPMVLNLSIGWDPDWGGSLASKPTWSPAILALYETLEYARCLGALTFAAAGNRSGGPGDDSDPMYPAGWGNATVTPARCASFGLTKTTVSSEGSPFIHAVGAVGELAHPLAITRENSLPRLAANGDHATAGDPLGSLPAPLTGTSVSTVVVATAAASVWANRPHLGADAIADAVYASGDPGMMEEAYWCTGSCEVSKTIDVCNAVRYACDASQPGYAHTSPATGPAPCTRAPTAMTCSAAPPDPVTIDVSELANLAAVSDDVGMGLAVTTYMHPACPGRVLTGDMPPWYASDPCPDQQFYDMTVEPWLVPQPIENECPDCFVLKSTGVVWVEWAGTSVGSLDSFSITLTNSAGNTRTWSTTATSTTPLTNPLSFTLPATATPTAVVGVVVGRVGETSYQAEIAVLP